MKILGMQFGKSEPKLEPVTMSVTNDEGAMKFFTLPYNYNTPQLYERLSGRGFIPFGPDNLYPQMLQNVFASSPLHNNLITFKQYLTVGAGFTVDTNALKGMELIEYNQFINFFDCDETLEDTLPKLALDYFINAQMFVEVTWDEAFTKIVKRRRISPEKIRYGNKDIYGTIIDYSYCFDWRQQGRYEISKIAPFNPSDKKNRVQLMKFELHSPGSNWYPLPSYQAAINYISLDSQIGEFLRTNIELSLAPSYALTFFRDPGSPEKKEVIYNQIQNEFAGARNAGRAMVFFAKDKNTAPTIEAITPSALDKQFNVTADSVRRSISTAHGVNPVIFGVEQSGGLGNGTDLPYAINLFNGSKIQPAQKDIERFISKIMRLSGLPPVNFKLNDVELLLPQDQEQVSLGDLKLQMPKKR